MQTKEQKRSEFALEMITDEFHDKVDEKTANFLVGMPTMILTNGIGQSMAFLLSKKTEEKYKKTFKILKEWLSKEIPTLESSRDVDFLKKFSAMTQQEYLTAQEESLKMLSWLKRYARSFEV